MLISDGFQFGNDHALIHVYSGAVFEKTIGDFVRNDVNIFDNVGKNVSVFYKNIDYSMNADIYVYPTKDGIASADLLRSHYQQVKNDVYTVRKNVQLAFEEENIFDFPSGDRFGLNGIYTFEEDNIEYISHLLLFGENEWFIKFRISYPATAQGDEGDDAIANLVSSFDYSTID